MTLDEQVSLLNELVFTIRASNLLKTSEPHAILGSELRLRAEDDSGTEGKQSSSSSSGSSMGQSAQISRSTSQLAELPALDGQDGSMISAQVSHSSNNNQQLLLSSSSSSGRSRMVNNGKPPTTVLNWAHHYEISITIAAICGTVVLSILTLTLIVLVLRNRADSAPRQFKEQAKRPTKANPTRSSRRPSLNKTTTRRQQQQTTGVIGQVLPVDQDGSNWSPTPTATSTMLLNGSQHMEMDNIGPMQDSSSQINHHHYLMRPPPTGNLTRISSGSKLDFLAPAVYSCSSNSSPSVAIATESTSVGGQLLYAIEDDDDDDGDEGLLPVPSLHSSHLSLRPTNNNNNSDNNIQLRQHLPNFEGSFDIYIM